MSRVRIPYPAPTLYRSDMESYETFIRLPDGTAFIDTVLANSAADAKLLFIDRYGVNQVIFLPTKVIEN